MIPHLDLYKKEIHQNIKKTNSSFQGLVDTQNLQSEQKTRYHVEAKMAPGENPIILSANITRSLGRKTSFAATVKNVFIEPASLSGIQPTQPRNMFISSGNTLNFAQPAVLERRRDDSSKQYSVETEILLPGMLGTRMLGLMEQRGSVWNSALRLKYGLGSEYTDLCGEKTQYWALIQLRIASVTHFIAPGSNSC